MQAGALGGQISGTIVEVGITYVRLATATGVISIPNSQVLNAVVGPLPDPSTYNTPQPTPPLMATPAGQPAPAPPLMANRNRPKNGQPSQRARRPFRQLRRPGRQPARSPARHPGAPPVWHPHVTARPA